MKAIIKKMVFLGFMGASAVGLGSCSREQSDLTSPRFTSIMDVIGYDASVINTKNLQSVIADSIVLEETEITVLVAVKEEEKLARDVYTALSDKWDNQIFIKISEAENTHMNAIIQLLQYSSPENTAIGAPGEFSNPVMTQLYDNLVIKGSLSEEEALKVGALIEEMDISDIVADEDEVTNENIILVFENLMKGSRNHLRAFTRQLTSLGITYTPVYLSLEEYSLIINSPVEKGSQYQMKRNGKQSNGTCSL